MRRALALGAALAMVFAGAAEAKNARSRAVTRQFQLDNPCPSTLIEKSRTARKFQPKPMARVVLPVPLKSQLAFAL